MLNSISLPFPFDDSDQKLPTTSDSDDKEEEWPADLMPNYEKVKSPTAKTSSTVPREESPMTPDSDDTKWSNQQPKTKNKEQ